MSYKHKQFQHLVHQWPDLSHKVDEKSIIKIYDLQRMRVSSTILRFALRTKQTVIIVAINIGSLR